MARKPKLSPSFFKILMNNTFTRQLELPPDFATKYGGRFPANVKLRTGSGSGRILRVKIEQIDDGKVGFTKGWSNFVKDHRLENGEVVVFWFNCEESMFDVSVFGVDCCEKEVLGFDGTVKTEYDDDDGVDSMLIDRDAGNKEHAAYTVKEEGGGTSTKRKGRFDKSCPCFDIVLKKYQRYRLGVPKEFAQAAGLIGKRVVVLEYQPKQQYSGVMLQDRNLGYHRLDMTVGWSSFVKENGLLFGKTYSLTFNPAKKVIEVKPFKRKN